MVRRMTNRWIASYEMSDRSEYLEHTGRLGMKWYQHIFGKDPAKGQKIIERKRKALSANVALAKDAARRGNAKRLAQLNKKTKKMIADVKQLEDQYEESTGKKYASSKPGEAEDAVAQTKQTSKESILKTGSAKDVFAIKDQLTQSELQDAINRIQKENTLAGLKASEVQQKIDNAKNFTNTIINAGNTAVNAFNAYENVAKMVNTISGEDTLPVFTGRKEKASKEAEKARAKKVKGIIERSDAQEIADNIHLFTNNEVQEAKKRLDNIKAIEKQIKHSELNEEEIDDFLEHSGRKGMKWYQHIFGKDDGRTVKEKMFPRMSKIEKKVLNKVNEKAPALLLPGKWAAYVEKKYLPTFYNIEKKMGTIFELNNVTTGQEFVNDMINQNINMNNLQTHQMFLTNQQLQSQITNQIIMDNNMNRLNGLM